ncbi:MAG: DUF2155 domain-containing protein [Mariprofundaceae bacterium]
MLFLCTGCDKQQEAGIAWQLPLQAPQDAHKAIEDSHLPEWAGLNQGEVVLMFLHKNTAQVQAVPVTKGQTVTFGIWDVRVLGLAQGLRIKSGAFLNDESVHNAAAFIELIKNGQIVYRGWLYKDFPELFGLDDPSWKVWVKDVSIQPSSTEVKTGSLSSAG